MTIHLTMIKLDLHSIYSNTGKWMAHHRLTNPRSQLGTQKNLKVEIWWVNIINSFKSLIHQFWKSLDSSEGVLDPLISSISSLHFQFFYPWSPIPMPNPQASPISNLLSQYPLPNPNPTSSILIPIHHNYQSLIPNPKSLSKNPRNNPYHHFNPYLNPHSNITIPASRSKFI